MPLELRGRIFTNATPKMARLLSWKYANMTGRKVVEDLRDNHGVRISRKFLQSVNQRVGEVLMDKEGRWTYDDGVSPDRVASIAISRDGTTSPIKGEGYRETMVGTIGLYDSAGERLHTIYTGCSPEKGKAAFDGVFSQEIEGALSRYPDAAVVGIADGAKDNWSFLSTYTSHKTIDFWHATEYLAGYAQQAYADEDERKAWLDKTCHDLKCKHGSAGRILRQMQEYSSAPDQIAKAITYFTNNKDKMAYASNLKKGWPIGSGVVEAGCKTLVKQRFSLSGCRWTRDTMDHILLSRSMILTKGRWKQFWSKINRYGL